MKVCSIYGFESDNVTDMGHQPNHITCSTFALETPDVNKTADSIWLKVGKLFSDTTGFTITIHN